MWLSYTFILILFPRDKCQIVLVAEGMKPYRHKNVGLNEGILQK